MILFFTALHLASLCSGGVVQIYDTGTRLMFVLHWNINIILYHVYKKQNLYTVHTNYKLYTEYYLQCYDSYYVNMTWSEKYCINYYNGHLASFNNQTQLNQFITMKNSSNWTPSPGHGGVVFGYNSIGKATNDATEWVYTDGLNTSFSHWNPGDPDGDNARCGMSYMSYM